MSLSNSHWAPVVSTKIVEVLADSTFTVPATPFSSITAPDANFALGIDHTLLKPDATPAQIAELCDQAIRYKFKVRTIYEHLQLNMLKDASYIVVLRERRQRGAGVAAP
jgi:hypothetical protein